MNAWQAGDEHVAYVSMEVAIENDANTYAGGLGVLAGDTLRAFADSDIPAVGVMPLNDAGLGEQHIEDGTQTYEAADWDPAEFFDPLDVSVTVTLGGESVIVGAWRYDVETATGSVPLVALDTDRPENPEWARSLTRPVYGVGLDRDDALAQEAVLGIGAVRVLDALDYDVHTYHLNEGHASPLVLELLRRTGINPDAVRERCVFTTHTPVEAAHESYAYDRLNELLDFPEALACVREQTDAESYHTTRVALAFSRYANAVSKRHQWVTHDLFPDYREHIDAITNGVHVPTWLGTHVADCLDAYIDGYRRAPSRLRHATLIGDDDLWAAHQAQKRDFFDLVAERTGVDLDADVLTLGFARRAVPYKRPTLLFEDTDRLKRIAAHANGLQVVFAGKGFPGDDAGDDLVAEVHDHIDALSGDVPMAYLPDYDLEIGRRMTAGVDVWLNTPRRPREACGTSGMKAALNGVPQLSTLDGWWVEGHVADTTGWRIGPPPFDPETQSLSDAAEDDVDSTALYDRLADDVLPAYYADRDHWLDVMRNCIALNGAHYHAGRMLDEYRASAYAGSVSGSR